MFTGLVQGLGRVETVEKRGAETRIRIAPQFALADYELGESIAVNGACMTVEQFGDGWFSFYSSAESLSKSNLASLRPGSVVNLERALAVGDRLGGHLVSGHVDCMATVDSITPAGESKIYRLTFSAAHGRYVVPKGSVALDGISLTVNDCGDNFLSVNIIPETQKVTTIKLWSPGYKVNMETDIIGKYVEKMLRPWKGDDEPAGKTSGLTEDFLKSHGFF